MKNKERITEALTAIAAGILTDILYNMLAGEYFSGKIINGEIEIHKVSPFLFWQKLCIIAFMFLALWIILAYIIPVIIYFINSFKSQNKIKINNKTVLESYTIFKDKVVELQGRVKYVNEESDGAYLLIFSDMCLCTLKMHEVFCTKKRENEIIIKSVFRIGPTVNDMDKKISLYEYLMITDIGKKILRFSYDNALKADCDLLNSDYQKISLYLEELQSLPKHLNIE